MLSRRASSNSHGQDSSYFIGWQEYNKNPFHQFHNPTGIIQMGLAENQLSLDIIESWIARNPDTLELKRNGESVFRKLALFQDYHGMPTLKTALSEFMAKIRGNKLKINPDNLVLTAGSTSANEILIFCLANPGEAFLVPTPYYPGFDRDLKWRTGVEIVPVYSSSSNCFKLTLSALEEAFERALKLNLKVKGVLITNPSNPVGTTMSCKELNLLIKFSISKNIHIVSDEIFSGAVFDSPRFTSIAEAVLDLNLEHTDIWKHIHIVYGLSKNLGLPGFRIGVIYSNNEKVVSAATKMSSFGLISSQTQYLLSNMLMDKKFMAKYMMENHKRLKKRKEKLVSGLKHTGIDCLRSNAGLFCWVDMRHLLASNTFDSEKKLWLKILKEVGLNVSPGSCFHCLEPGWFRFCFANMNEETLGVAIRRIKFFVDSINIGQYCYSQSNCGKRITKWIFKLSSYELDHEASGR